MVRTGFTDQIVSCRLASLCLQPLLQCRFEVGELIFRSTHIRNLWLKKTRDQVPWRLKAAIQKHCTDDCLEGIDQQRLFGPPARLLFTSAELQILPEPQLLRILDEVRCAYKETLKLGELSFIESRVSAIENIAHYKA